MFCITGEWHRALTQLAVAGELDPLTFPMVQSYKAAILAAVAKSWFGSDPELKRRLERLAR